MSKNIVLEICITLMILSCIGATAMYLINDRKLMAQNITEAIAKSMDPLSVRCSYASTVDTICVAYAASNKK